MHLISFNMAGSVHEVGRVQEDGATTRLTAAGDEGLDDLDELLAQGLHGLPARPGDVRRDE